MRYPVLATDYDGTIAHHGEVDETTLDALARLKESGRQLLLVTGRELPELRRDFARFDLFERIIAENGALLYRPATDEERALADPPPARVADELRRRGVKKLSVGRVIIASHEPYETIVLQAIRDLGLECQVIFNKGAVMVLPSGINKATGLKAALRELKMSPHNVVGVGDAENDHAFLDLCECAVAVANALPALKEKADLVTRERHGAGVTELIERLLDNDLADLAPHPARNEVPLGHDGDKPAIPVRPFGENILVAGASGGGKSTFVTGLIERFLERGYQALILDPEGDHGELDGALVLDSHKHAPTTDEVIDALQEPTRSIVVNMTSLRLEDQPAFAQRLLEPLREMRACAGRPHWIVLDEVHHVLPRPDDSAPRSEAFDLRGIVAATVEPEHVDSSFLRAIDRLVVTGAAPEGTLRNFCRTVGGNPPRDVPAELPRGGILSWRRGEPRAVELLSIPAKSARRRHVRKYAHGDLGPDGSFLFEGPEKKLRLRAKNLVRFLELADGVDDDTWEYHRMRKDYSDWMRTHIKDDDLADAVSAIEESSGTAPAESRAAIRATIEQRYTAPA